MADKDDTYWWCLRHNRVETYAESDSPDRLGPYPTHSAAEDALRTIAEREKRYDEQDREWDEGE